MTTARRLVPWAWASALTIVQRGCGPRGGLIPEGGEESLRLVRFLVLPQCLLQKLVAAALEHRVHGQAERIVHAEFFAERVGLGNSKAAVAAEDDPHVRPHLAEPLDQVRQVVFDSQGGRGRTKQQADHYHQIVFLAGDRTGEVLVLIVIAVEEGQLLLSMSGIVEDVDVEGQV